MDSRDVSDIPLPFDLPGPSYGSQIAQPVASSQIEEVSPLNSNLHEFPLSLPPPAPMNPRSRPSTPRSRTTTRSPADPDKPPDTNRTLPFPTRAAFKKATCISLQQQEQQPPPPPPPPQRNQPTGLGQGKKHLSRLDGPLPSTSRSRRTLRGIAKRRSKYKYDGRNNPFKIESLPRRRPHLLPPTTFERFVRQVLVVDNRTPDVRLPKPTLEYLQATVEAEMINKLRIARDLVELRKHKTLMVEDLEVGDTICSMADDQTSLRDVPPSITPQHSLSQKKFL